MRSGFLVLASALSLTTQAQAPSDADTAREKYRKLAETRTLEIGPKPTAAQWEEMDHLCQRIRALSEDFFRSRNLAFQVQLGDYHFEIHTGKTTYSEEGYRARTRGIVDRKETIGPHPGGFLLEASINLGPDPGSFARGQVFKRSPGVCHYMQLRIPKTEYYLLYSFTSDAKDGLETVRSYREWVLRKLQ